MATYKVIQDIEADDKLVGPLSLRQFIYAGISATSIYLTFLSITKGLAFFAVVTMPVALFTGFFAFPWGKDQPTEVWALAKVRFMLKPRKRVWNQSGVKEMVTITAPKQIERELTNGLSQYEVRSRLRALADTIDSRGWAVKNLNVSAYNPANGGVIAPSDRLVSASSLPQEVSNIDIQASDDMLDESANPLARHFEDMMQASSQARHQQLVEQMQQPTLPDPVPMPATPQAAVPQDPQAQQNNYWFMQQPSVAPGQAGFVDATVVAPGEIAEGPTVPQAATPTAEEQALVEKFKAENHSFSRTANPHLKTLYPVGQEPPEDMMPVAGATPQQTAVPQQQIPALQQPVSAQYQALATPAQPPAAASPVAPQQPIVPNGYDFLTQNIPLPYAPATTAQAYPAAGFTGPQAAVAVPSTPASEKQAVTPMDKAAILNLAHNDDLDVATIARQARKQVEDNGDEVVISLH